LPIKKRLLFQTWKKKAKRMLITGYTNSHVKIIIFHFFGVRIHFIIVLLYYYSVH
jgi:hypothetical protein